MDEEAEAQRNQVTCCHTVEKCLGLDLNSGSRARIHDLDHLAYYYRSKCMKYSLRTSCVFSFFNGIELLQWRQCPVEKISI